MTAADTSPVAAAEWVVDLNAGPLWGKFADREEAKQWVLNRSGIQPGTKYVIRPIIPKDHPASDAELGPLRWEETPSSD